jgi:hypothetical protein
VIKDVIREICLTRDRDLIIQIVYNSLFKKDIQGLIEQTIQSDDDELIEQMILNPLLKDFFKQVMDGTSKEDRERLYTIFTSSPYFSQKPAEFVHEVRSWAKAG